MPTAGLLTRFRNGEVTLSDLLQQIEAQEPNLHCWTELRLEEQSGGGPLAGVPYGAKDIFEAKGYRTSYGSHLFADHVSDSDAGLIELLRAKGARLMGKTQTTAFAYYDPAPTRNPVDPTHTPGGSSSGSAAAVAAGMVPFALGTQTQGSVIRPAAFCGVVGFKPTFGLLPLSGAMGFAPTLDTAGLFTQSALDMRLLWQAMGYSVDRDLPAQYGMVEFEVEPDMQEAFRHAVQTLSHFGCVVRRFPLPDSFRELLEAVRTINQFEGARTHESTYRQHGAKVGVKLAMLIRAGLEIPEERYHWALEVLAAAKRDMAQVFETFPVLLSPAAPGQAPKGLASTGDPRCNAPWTGLGVPAVTIPVLLQNCLPMGLQMTAAWGEEATLLSAAAHGQALLSAGGEE